MAQESKSILSQAKHTRTASAHLTSQIDSVLQELAEHEMLTDKAKSQIPSEVLNTDISTLVQHNLWLLIGASCAELKRHFPDFVFLFPG